MNGPGALSSWALLLRSSLLMRYWVALPPLLPEYVLTFRPSILHPAGMTISRRILSAAETLDWLRLIRSENVGPRTFFRLLERFGSAAVALEQVPDLARKGGKRTIVLASKAEAQRELAAWKAIGAKLVAWGEPDYPELLAAIDDPPPLLGVRGHLHLLRKPCVAIVGARNATLAGQKFTQQLAYDLGQAGFVVVSGLARGIDTAAHRGAMPTGTVACMATGLDVVYPPENDKLYEDLCSLGAAVSEMPPGTQPQPSLFPRRNRLISGLCYGVVVIEATPKSGSLITARVALDQGREVFAVPGSPTDPRAQGPNDLIRHGAVLTEGVGDIVQALAAVLAKPVADPAGDGYRSENIGILDEVELVPARRALLSVLGSAPVTVDTILRECQFSAAVVATVLLELELAGRLERHPGSQVSLIA